MYTLINCGTEGCEEAGDKLSVHVKDGADGEFVQVFSKKGSLEDRWENNLLSIVPENEDIWVR